VLLRTIHSSADDERKEGKRDSAEYEQDDECFHEIEIVGFDLAQELCLTMVNASRLGAALHFIAFFLEHQQNAADHAVRSFEVLFISPTQLTANEYANLLLAQLGPAFDEEFVPG
jgi:hypothetical protein